MINPQQAFSSTPGLQDKHAFRWQHGGYNVSDSFRLGHDRTFVGGAATNPDFEMRNVHWSDDISTVSNLLSLQFPVIVKVVKGYYGHDGQHLIDGQVRVVAKYCFYSAIILTSVSIVTYQRRKFSKITKKA